MKLQNRLYLSVILMAVAALAIGGVSLFTLSAQFGNQEKVYNSGLAVYHLKKVSDAYGLDVIGAVEKVRDAAPWAWEEGADVISNAEKQANDHWEAYQALEKTKDEKFQATIVDALINNNKHLMESLKSDFANKDARDLEIQGSSVIYPSIEPILDNIHKLEDINEKAGQDAIAQAQKGFTSSFDFLAGLLSVILLTGLIASFWLGSWAIRPVAPLAQNFGETVEEVFGISQQVVESTSQLSFQLSESASLLQKTGAAMEQAVSIVQENNKETVQVRHYVEETKSSINTGEISALGIAENLKILKAGAEKVFQVVKTIEEIAFQTNILALNAGVEAVRAGDQGKEFVVVVEEIRNLSHRCSQVARETSKLVTDNVNHIAEGVRLSEEAGKAMLQASERTGKLENHLTIIESGLSLQTRSLQEINSTTGNAEREAYRNNSMSEKTGSLGINLSQQIILLRQVSNRLAGLLLGSGMKTKSNMASKINPVHGESSVTSNSGGLSSMDMKVMEKTGTNDAKIVHMNK